MTRLVFGIDPGPEEHAIVVWDPALRRVIRSHNYSTVETQALLSRAVSDEDVVACEWIESFGMAVGQPVFRTVFEIGRICCSVSGVRLVPRQEIKLHLCRDSRAKDTNVRTALIDSIGIVGTKKNPGPLHGISSHLWSALAVAVYAGDVPEAKREFFPSDGLVFTKLGVKSFRRVDYGKAQV